MKVRVTKRTENHLELEIEGEDHTLCTLLKKALLDDENVVFAGYRIDHPLLSNPKIYITTNQGVPPEDALRDAIKRLKDTLTKISDLFFSELSKVKSSTGG
ncbi:MAG: DNA-directed RNA polymerase subunit L [Candidatus Jordarchaeales archaeon]